MSGAVASSLPGATVLECPDCGGSGGPDATTASWRCEQCGRLWPCLQGVYDFRPDAGISRDDWSFAHSGGLDAASRRARLAAAYSTTSYEDLARLYFDLFATTEEIRERELASLRDSRALADEWLYQLEQVVPLDRLAANGGWAVDVGCGGGGLAIALAQRGFRVVGVDVDLERLLIASKHAESRGAQVQFVAAHAERLPIQDGAVRFVSCLEVLEHVSDQMATVTELKRILHDDGRLYLTTPNRFSLGREAHVRLWALGYLPRAWMDRYVQWRLGVRYTGKRNPSYREVRGLFTAAFGERWRIVRERRLRYTPQGRVAEVLSRVPFVGRAVTLVGAGFHVVAG